MSKDDTSYVPLEIEAPPSTTYYIHVERKIEPTIMVGVGKLLHEDEDFDEKVKEIIAAATALHPHKKVTV